MTARHLHDIKADYASGALARDAYWSAMRESHLNLLDYQALIREAGLDRIEIDAGELRVVLPSGLKFRWQPRDIRTVPNILLNHGAYEPEVWAVLSHLARDSRVILDVGANIGWYALHLARLLDETGGMIYAFEPVPRTYAELVRNVELNGYASRIVPCHHALGESAGAARFYIPAFTGSVAASRRQLFPDDANEAVECRVETLDAVARARGIARVDLIKCDVEGSELFVLRGGAETIRRDQPIIMLEMLRKWARVFDYHPNDIIAFLGDLGYRCWSWDGAELIPVPAVDDACTQTNFFFLHDARHHDIPARAAAMAAGAQP